MKPSNVLVAENEGVPVVKVIAFGIAKAVSDAGDLETRFTRHGQLVGTLEYMSPEQAQGEGIDTPHARALPALLEAALHQDSAVRFAAMTALREGASANAPNSGALLAARAAITSDDNVAVRRQAFGGLLPLGRRD